MTTTPPSGSFFPTGVTTVTVNSIDACGNASACAFDVLVSCFGVNRAKIGTKPARCEGIELLEVTSLAADGSELVCLTVPGPGETELPSNVTVDDGVNGPQTIHTSCSQPIEIGDVFGYYTVTDVVKIFDSSPDARGNDIDLRGTFVPAVPIDFALDDVSFTIDDGAGHLYFFDIPAGSFQGHGSPEKQEFEFEGMIDGMEVKAKFEGCGYRLKVKGVPGASDIVGTTLTLGLLAGANGAQEVVVMEDKSNHLKFKRAPKVNCCPVCDGITSMQVSSDQGVLVIVPEPGHDKLGSNTVVDDGVNGPVTIHTSCSQPLEAGDVFGPYTVSELIKIFE